MSIARAAPDTIRNAAHGQSRFSWVFRAVMTAATATGRRPRTKAPDFGKANRSARRKSTTKSSARDLWFRLQAASGFAHVLLACVVLPSADEVFLREHRYREVVFRPEKPNLLSKSAC